MDKSIDICLVCNTSMRDPRILPCAHSFCWHCLETSNISKDLSKCPSCQMDFEKPQGGLKDLKKNEFISKLLELKLCLSNKKSCEMCNESQAIRFCVTCSINLCAKCLNHHKQSQVTKGHEVKAIKRKLENVENIQELKHGNHGSTKICIGCDKNQAAKFCIDCSNNYCLSCLDYHKYIPSTRNHQFIDIDEKPEKVIKKNYECAACENHGEVKNLLCYDCDIFTCSLCMILDHKSHLIIHMSQYYDEMKKRLDDDIISKELILQIVAWSRESSENFRNENERVANELRKEIEKRGREMKKNINSVVKVMKKSLEENLKGYHEEADDVLLKLKNLDENINEHINTSKQQLEDLKNRKIIETPRLKDKDKHTIIPKYDKYIDLAMSREIIETDIKSKFRSILDLNNL